MTNKSCINPNLQKTLSCVERSTDRLTDLKAICILTYDPGSVKMVKCLCTLFGAIGDFLHVSNTDFVLFLPMMIILSHPRQARKTPDRMAKLSCQFRNPKVNGIVWVLLAIKLGSYILEAILFLISHFPFFFFFVTLPGCLNCTQKFSVVPNNVCKLKSCYNWRSYLWLLSIEENSWRESCFSFPKSTYTEYRGDLIKIFTTSKGVMCKSQVPRSKVKVQRSASLWLGVMNTPIWLWGWGFDAWNFLKSTVWIPGF